MPSVAVHRPGREPLIIERVIHVRALGPQHLIFYCVTFRTFRTDIRLLLHSSDWRPILAANSLFFMGCIFATVMENPPLQFYEPSLGPSSGAVSDSELSDWWTVIRIQVGKSCALLQNQHHCRCHHALINTDHRCFRCLQHPLVIHLSVHRRSLREMAGLYRVAFNQMQLQFDLIAWSVLGLIKLEFHCLT